MRSWENRALIGFAIVALLVVLYQFYLYVVRPVALLFGWRLL